MTGPASEARGSGRLALGFSAVGHFLFHYFAAMYFTIVLAIAKDWTASDYETLIALWTPASALIGLAALPAGRLADMWSAPGMLAIMFLGMGVATAAAGFAPDTVMLGVMLAAIGLFGAIYHPVGIPWLIKTSAGATGQKLAVNGIFGGLGAAAAGALTGVLIDLVGWRMAFMVPGTLCVVVGIALVWCIMRGRVVDGTAAAGEAVGGRDGRGRLAAFLALLFPMFAIGLIYNTTQTAMPKLFEENMLGWLGGDISRIGFAVGAVYTAGALMQLVGGRLADRYSLKLVYFLGWLLMAPLLLAMALFGEGALFLAAIGLVVVNTSALPAENMMLARFAPAKHQGLAFGIKFVLAFGAGPIGVLLIKYGREMTGDFSALLTGLAGLAAVAVLVVLLLPRDARARDAAAAGAPAE
ncbi:MFS transporter [Marivibrio halodurans]|uniref:MFS transporter n=1 Tax=Marivibrio halodurans TaxID=2039722 RepID=A0A8J7SI14_9PROT|nr:MFS transporter [Marivibrio halodurans]MBP5856793.1 MFS transporter [Marivibrio halodurans]